MGEEEKKISEFNESMLQIQRLDNKWREIANAREQGDLSRAKFKLDSIEIELMNDAKILTNREYDYVKELKNINKEIYNLNPKETKSIIKLYILLKEKEILLRQIQQECGKGSRYKASDEDEM